MKKFNSIIVVGLLVLLATTACNTAQKAYRKGDYYKATIEAIARLRNKPDDNKAQTVLLNAYPMAQKTALREIENANVRDDLHKYDIMVYQYSRLNNIANQIYASPKAYELIPRPAEYQAEIAEAKRKAAEHLYNLGEAALAYRTLEQSRIAYNHFNRANEYVYGYKDVFNKIEESLYYGTLRVLVDRPVTAGKYQLSAEFFSNNLIAEMTRQSQHKFIRFYTMEEAQSLKMNNPHQFLVFDFTDYTIGNVRETINTQELKRDSVVVGTVNVDGKAYNAYNTVYAKFTTNRREILSAGVLSVRIIDAPTNRIIQHQNFVGEYVWFTEWSGYSGDERALTDKQKRMTQLQPVLPPPHQDLFIEFTKPIYSQVLTFVRSAYRNY
jgi:hypothetical protein